MSRIASIAVIVSVFGSSAFGSAVIQLLPEVVEIEASETPTTVSFEVYLSGQDGLDHYLRLIQHDIQLSELPPFNVDYHYNTQACEQLPELCGLGYAEVGLDGVTPATVFSGLSEDTFTQILLPGSGMPILTMTFDVEVPAAAIGESFLIDVLNPETGNGSFSARIDFGFGGPDDPIITWSVYNGLITGNTATINVVPEPASMALLGIGAVVLMRRPIRRRRQAQ